MDFDRTMVYFIYGFNKSRQDIWKTNYLLKEVPNTCLFCIVDTSICLKKSSV